LPTLRYDSVENFRRVFLFKLKKISSGAAEVSEIKLKSVKYLRSPRQKQFKLSSGKF
jgi:hypothetical protein